MDSVLKYTLSLQDHISAKLSKIGIESNNALNKFASLQIQAKNTGQLLKDMGGSVGSLREKLNLLRAEKEWIPQSNLSSIRTYNSEIKKLEKEIQRLDTINGSVFKSKLKDAVNNIPYASLITNPVTMAGAALFGAGKMAMSFDEGMAKINTTAQLTPIELTKLKKELLGIGRGVGADLATVPEAFEKILSQTNDLALSTDILKSALKGSKAGFADQNIVAGALSNTLSLVGKENTSAAEVLDTLFAAKRLGAGEFADFANYIPGLIASGDALGMKYKQVAGLFSYMTAKGLNAERSSTLLQNAFTALGKSEITNAMEAEGISVFSVDGSMKKADEIFGALEKKLAAFGSDDQSKSNFLEKIGLKDAQAKQAFMVLASDSKKLAETITGVANAQGESDAAFKDSENGMQKISKLWSVIQGLGISFGGVISSILIPALTGILFVITPVVDALSWLFDEIANGNPMILALAGVVGLLTVAYNANAIALQIKELWLRRTLVMEKLSAFWAGVLATKTNLVTAATWLWNAALAVNPIVWVVAGIAAMVAILVVAWKKIDWFRGGVMAAWEAIKQFGIILKDFVIDRIKGLLSGVAGIGSALVKLFKGDFAGAWETAKSAVGDLVGAGAVKKAIGSAKEAGKKIGAAYQEGVAQVNTKKVEAINAPANKIAPAMIPGIVMPQPNSPAANDNTIGGTTNSIASGGTRNTEIHINMRNMVENISFGCSLEESTDEMKRRVEQALMQVLNMAYATA